LLYPAVCEICEAARVAPGEGYVCTGCRAAPGHVVPVRAPFCGRCGLPYPGEVTGAFVCGNCRELDLDFDRARAAVAATPFLLDVVHRYKYRGALWFEPFLTELLVDAAAPDLVGGAWDAVVPVPLHPVRLRERGFNQAERLARRLAEGVGIPCRVEGVRRRAATRTQALLDRGERTQNMARAFVAGAGGAFAGQRVVVVDDVLTTGATCSAVSRALREAGAVEVIVWTVARGV
jgi:competence protein ComFC